MELALLVIIPIMGAVISYSIKKNLKLLEFVAVISGIIEFVLITHIVSTAVSSGVFPKTQLLQVDELAALLLVIVSTVCLFSMIYSLGYIRAELEKNILGMNRVRQYFALMHVFIFAMFLAAMSSQPLIAWIALEATTLSTALLISFYNKPTATEAAWKYLIINSVGLLLGFFGTFLYLSAVGGSDFLLGVVTWSDLKEAVKTVDPLTLKIAFILVFLGYGTKIGLVPMHTWKPDAYGKAPMPIVALFSGALLNVALFILLRFKSITDSAIGVNMTQQLFVFFGVLSIVVASLLMLDQKNYKRLLAYSSIEHAGIMTLGVGLGGVAFSAALFHSLYHALAKSSLFLTAGNIFLRYSSTKIAQVRGMIRALPASSILFFAGVIAIMGMPPFGLFVTKFQILAVSIETHMVAGIVAFLGLSVAFIAWLRHIHGMVFGDVPDEVDIGEAGTWTLVPPLVLILLLLVFSLVTPHWLSYLVREISKTF